jgi:hypothetical protein
VMVHFVKMVYQNEGQVLREGQSTIRVGSRDHMRLG